MPILSISLTELLASDFRMAMACSSTSCNINFLPKEREWKKKQILSLQQIFCGTNELRCLGFHAELRFHSMIFLLGRLVLSYLYKTCLSCSKLLLGMKLYVKVCVYGASPVWIPDSYLGIDSGSSAMNAWMNKSCSFTYFYQLKRPCISQY